MYHNDRRTRNTNSSFKSKGENAWGGFVEEKVVTPLKNLFKPKPIYEPGEEVLLHDQHEVIKANVVYSPSLNRFHLIDSQGFIHLAEVIEKDQQENFGGAQLRAVVSPKNKYLAGYSQDKSGGKPSKTLRMNRPRQYA